SILQYLTYYSSYYTTNSAHGEFVVKFLEKSDLQKKVRSSVLEKWTHALQYHQLITNPKILSQLEELLPYDEKAAIPALLAHHYHYHGYQPSFKMLFWWEKLLKITPNHPEGLWALSHGAADLIDHAKTPKDQDTLKHTI